MFVSQSASRGDVMSCHVNRRPGFESFSIHHFKIELLLSCFISMEVSAFNLSGLLIQFHISVTIN